MLEEITFSKVRIGPLGMSILCGGAAELMGPVLEAIMESLKELA